jgi:hypothetical protein
MDIILIMLVLILSGSFISGLFSLGLWVFSYVLRYWPITFPVVLLSLLLPWYGCLFVIWVTFFISFHLSEKMPDKS